MSIDHQLPDLTPIHMIKIDKPYDNSSFSHCTTDCRISTAIVAAAVAVTLVNVVTSQEVRRAPSMGFMGMRGKKSFFADDENTIEEYKRAPLMGFQVHALCYNLKYTLNDNTNHYIII